MLLICGIIVSDPLFNPPANVMLSTHSRSRAGNLTYINLFSLSNLEGDHEDGILFDLVCRSYETDLPRTMMNTISFLILLSTFYPTPTKQTEIIFDDPSLKPINPFSAKQICTNARTETCCEPLSLQIDSLPHANWFHPKRVTYRDLPPSTPRTHYLAVFTYENGQVACRGKVTDYLLLVDQKSWQSVALRYPYLTGATYMVRSEPVPLMYNVYPDVVVYQGINYTDDNRGDGVYLGDDGRYIHGVPLFCMSS